MFSKKLFSYAILILLFLTTMLYSTQADAAKPVQTNSGTLMCHASFGEELRAGGLNESHHTRISFNNPSQSDVSIAYVKIFDTDGVEIFSATSPDIIGNFKWSLGPMESTKLKVHQALSGLVVYGTEIDFNDLQVFVGWEQIPANGPILAWFSVHIHEDLDPVLGSVLNGSNLTRETARCREVAVVQ